MPSLPTCPGCGSELVQPLRWQQQSSGELLVELRCPECFVVMQACHTAQEMEELDRRQTASREQIQNAYDRAVAENMEATAASLHEALARDLVGPDDFAPRGGRRKGRLPRAA
jgi:erythromycin esterase-like protein